MPQAQRAAPPRRRPPLDTLYHVCNLVETDVFLDLLHYTRDSPQGIARP